ncbi:3',5'-cyclic adenosine monophosphate phosphodiesterase CpdA [Lachnospiraceae bacterium]|nr:3',5'-cyclic adenosine monophosphate phosphodiesterase CpdA [Lachnospiraceae bacterium]
MKSRILHLSDIHLGNDIGITDYEIDDKLGVFRNNLMESKQNYFDILLDYLSNAGITYDFVVISGDIVHRGQYDYSSYFNTCILKLIELKRLPNRNHIIIVPGNHDIVEGNDKWKIFEQYLDIQFVKPIMKLNSISRNEYLQKVNNLLRKRKRSKFISNSDFPFIIDKNKKIILYAFNSCSLCQMNNVIIDGKSEKLDLPRIDNLELDYFIYTMKSLKEIDNEYNDYLKIAVFHHHISSFTEFEEIKSFETLSNAGIVKKTLIENGVKLVLHGHKHYPNIYLDTTASKKGGLTVVSGGSICEIINRKGVKQGFFDLLYDSKSPNEINQRYIELINSKRNYDRVPYEKIELPQNKSYIKKSKKIDVANINRLILNVLEKNFVKNNNICGWDKKILDKKTVGILGTAFGIILMEMTGGNSKFYIENKTSIINSLHHQRKTDGGFGVLFQSESSIIATCWVAQAFKISEAWDYYLKTINVLLEFEEIKSEEIISESYESNTFTVAFLMRVLLDYYMIFQNNHVKSTIDVLYKSLKDGYLEDSQGIRWAKNLKNDEEESIPHTCHACIALIQYQEIFKRNDEELFHILKYAKKWLLDRQDMVFVVERIRHNGMEVVYEHNTITWYIIALIKLGVSEFEEKVIKNVDSIMNKFDWEKGVWKYNDSYNIWETYDSLIALREYIIFSAKY